MPPAVLRDLVKHPLTDKGLAAFLADWEKTGLILWFDDGDGRVRFSNTPDNEIFHTKNLRQVSLGPTTCDTAAN